MLQILARLWKEEDGQGMAEYGLILALVSVVVITVLATMGENIQAKFQEVSDAIAGESSN